MEKKQSGEANFSSGKKQKLSSHFPYISLSFLQSDSK